MSQPSSIASPSGMSWQTPAVIIVCGCLIALIGFGVRSSFGFFLEPMSAARGWGREVFAFSLAIQNLLWGLGQPFAGMVADRYGAARVLVVGGILYAAGVALMTVSGSPGMLTLTAGVLIGIGLAGASFTVVLAAFARMVPPERRSWALGIGTAAGSFGQFVFAHLGQAFIAGYGWSMALLLMAGMVLLIVPLAGALSGRPDYDSDPTVHKQSIGNALGEAFGYRSYLLLVSGFFVCGFHVAFITVHLPAYLADLGLGIQVAAWAIGLVGLFNIVGSYAAGVLGGRYSKRYMLSAIYFLRAVVILLFITIPPSTVTVLLFAAAMGVLWLSTVPLTSGLVAVMFGPRYMATLFGVVFFSHQVGSFLGVWLGGYLYDRTGSYDVVWWLGIALGLFAALIHLPISERPIARLAPAT